MLHCRANLGEALEDPTFIFYMCIGEGNLGDSLCLAMSELVSDGCFLSNHDRSFGF